MRMSAPDSSKWVAKQCRRVWHPTGFAMCLTRRVPDGALQDRLVQVVAPCFLRGRIDAMPRFRKDVLPSPLSGRARVFPFEGGPEGRPGVVKFQIPGVDLSDFGKMGGEPLPPPIGKDRHPVLLALPVPDRDLTAIQIDVLHTQPHRLHESKPASVQQRNGKAIGCLDRIT